ncbi:hypothetical protein [Streptomyces albogriseolus]|uniref:hypothetical protein n=1 Tax=Streptomyces albogriseolus TaxID=1887 RepID=UPI00345F3065
MTTPTATETPQQAALRLGCGTSQVGRCATCQSFCQRYGPGGSPLCPACKSGRPGV